MPPNRTSEKMTKPWGGDEGRVKKSFAASINRVSLPALPMVAWNRRLCLGANQT